MKPYINFESVIGFFHNRYERALKETMEQNVLVHDMLRSLTSSSEIAEFVFSHMVMRLRKAPEHHKDLFVDVPRDVLARLDAYIHAQLGLTRDAFAGGGTKGSSDYRLAGKQLAELEKLLAVVRSEIDKNVTVGSCPDDCGPFVS